MTILERIGVRLPIIQAPMAGVSTPALAAAVCEAGGLGSLGLGSVDAAGAEKAISSLRALTRQPIHVNLFAHAPAQPDPVREAAWLAALAPSFRRFGAEPPKTLRPSYRSFLEDEAMLAALVAAKPEVVSFHFGLPTARQAAALKAAGCILLSTATSLHEAEAAKRAGMDGVIAQGFEAGGHRGMFEPSAPDDRLGMAALVRLLAVRGPLPVIAAGGMMDGAGVAAALQLGAEAAQLGTAFVGCPESSADDAYRRALFSEAALHTTMTAAISGRPARGLPNRFTAWGEGAGDAIRPDYPIAYDAGKALNAAAKAKGEGGYGAQWAGQGAPMARSLPAADLMRALEAELNAARGG